MIKFNIVSGNILDYLDNADLIINSANKYMNKGSGVCSTIYNAAGSKELEKYCIDNFKEHMKTNEIRITPGFNLKVDIMHILVPKKHESIDPYLELVDAYSEILLTASEKGYFNIVSVSLGTGFHGYEHKDVVGPALGLIRHYLTLPSMNKISFTLVLPNDEIRDLYLNHKQLTFDEYKTLSIEDKKTRYVELSAEDKFKVRISM